MYSIIRRGLKLGFVLQIILVLSADANFPQNENNQEIDVKGKVIDATGEPLIGVNILIVGTGSGTITDIEGNYTLNEIHAKLSDSQVKSIFDTEKAP